MLQKKYTRIPVLGPAPVLKNAGLLWVPYLGIRLGSGPKRTPVFQALIDSGSPYCLFSSRISDFLGLRLENGVHEEINGISGKTSEAAYFHQLRLFVETEWVIEITAGFVRGLAIGGILGRVGFFDHFRVCFDHSEFPPSFELTRIAEPQ